MMKYFKDFLGIFSEISPISLMRFMSFLTFFFSVYQVNYIIKNYGGQLDNNHILLILILFSLSFFPKILQKIIENKMDDYDS